MYGLFRQIPLCILISNHWLYYQHLAALMQALVDGPSSTIPKSNDRISSVPCSTALTLYTDYRFMHPCTMNATDNQTARDANIIKAEQVVRSDCIDGRDVSTSYILCIDTVDRVQLVDGNEALQNELQIDQRRSTQCINGTINASKDAVIIRKIHKSNQSRKFKCALRMSNIGQLLEMLQKGECLNEFDDKIRKWLTAKVWSVRREELCIRSVYLSSEYLQMIKKHCFYRRCSKGTSRAAKIWKIHKLTRKEEISKLIENVKMGSKGSNVKLLENERNDPTTCGKMLTRASRKAKSDSTLSSLIPHNGGCLSQEKTHPTKEKYLRNTFDEELCGICGELEDEEGSDLVLWCKTGCYTAYHYSCLGLTDEVDDADWKCEQCENREQICFACGRNGSIDERSGVLKCSGIKCHKFYHQSCVAECSRTRMCGLKRKRDSQTKGGLNASSVESDNDEDVTFRFRCPRHICAVCEDTKSSELMFCIKCPEAYHTSCVPPSARYNTVGLLCYRHRHDNLPKIPSDWYTDHRMAVVTVDYTVKFPVLFLPSIEPVASNLQDPHHFRIPMEYLVRVHTHPPPYRRLTRNSYTFKQPRPSSEDVPTCVCTDRCGDGCINRLSLMECFGPAPTDAPARHNRTFNCHVGENCGNRALYQRIYPRTELFHSFEKGFALRAKEPVQAGQLVIEYVGEVINEQEKDRRLEEHARKHPHDRNMYIMELRKQEYIDARFKGSISRFINHSCDPNCHLVKWCVRGLDRIAITALRDIEPEEELSYDYQFHTSQALQWKCFCNSSRCRGTMAPENTRKGKSKQKRLLIATKLSNKTPQKRSKRTLVFKKTFAMQVIVGDPASVSETTIRSGPEEIELTIARQCRLFLPRNATRGAKFLLRKLLKDQESERASNTDR